MDSILTEPVLKTCSFVPRPQIRYSDIIYVMPYCKRWNTCRRDVYAYPSLNIRLRESGKRGRATAGRTSSAKYDWLARLCGLQISCVYYITSRKSYRDFRPTLYLLRKHQLYMYVILIATWILKCNHTCTCNWQEHNAKAAQYRKHNSLRKARRMWFGNN